MNLILSDRHYYVVVSTSTFPLSNVFPRYHRQNTTAPYTVRCTRCAPAIFTVQQSTAKIYSSHCFVLSYPLINQILLCLPLPSSLAPNLFDSQCHAVTLFIIPPNSDRPPPPPRKCTPPQQRSNEPFAAIILADKQQINFTPPTNFPM